METYIQVKSVLAYVECTDLSICEVCLSGQPEAKFFVTLFGNDYQEGDVLIIKKQR